MNLSDEDVRVAEKYLSKREKEIAAWPKKRWLILIIFSIIAVLGARNVSQGLETIKNETLLDDGIRSAIKDSPEPGQEHLWAAGTMIKLAKILAIHQQLMNYGLLDVALGLLQLFSGLAMVCIIVLRWNYAERDALICRVLRAQLNEVERAVGEKNGSAGTSSNSLSC